MMSDPKVHASRNKRLLFFSCPDCLSIPLHGILISSPVLPPKKNVILPPYAENPSYATDGCPMQDCRLI